MSAATVAELQHLLRSRHEGSIPRSFPVHPALQPLFPAGLRGGMTYAVPDSPDVALGLLAGLDGGWCAAVGLPDLGVEAATAWGVDLDHLVLLPRVPAERWLDTICTLAEAMDVVLTATPPPLSPGAVNRLQARLRNRRIALVVVGDWRHAHTRVETRTLGWDGLADGHGRLLRRRMQLTARRGPQVREHTLSWPPR